MKIAMLGNASNRHTWRWCAWLGAQGHHVVLYSDSAPREDMDYGEVRIVRPHWTLLQNAVTFKLRQHPYANNRDKWRVYAHAIRAQKPDVLHAQEALGYGPMLAHFPEFPRVLTPWGADIEGLSRAQEGDPLRRELILQGIRAADIITTNAAGLEDHWHALTGAGEKFRFFSWGVDTVVFHPRPIDEQQRVRAKCGLDEKARLLLSPRLAKPMYGIELILEAWKQCGEETGGAQLVVLRAGSDEESWRAVQLAAGDASSIRCVDEYLSPEEMAALYSASVGTVMIPQTDLLAMSLLEAIACGSIPVLAEQPCYRTAVVDLADHAESRAKGIYVAERSALAVQDALRRWMALPANECVRLAEHNVEYAHTHQRWQDCAGRIEEVYRAACSA